jgi:hypothetical protein
MSVAMSTTKPTDKPTPRPSLFDDDGWDAFGTALLEGVILAAGLDVGVGLLVGRRVRVDVISSVARKSSVA